MLELFSFGKFLLCYDLNITDSSLISNYHHLQIFHPSSTFGRDIGVVQYRQTHV